MRSLGFALLILALTVPLPASATQHQKAATLYKTPLCGCCEGHADYLRKNGLQVKVVETPDLPLLRKQHGIPQAFEGCHMITLDGYVIEGHVPINPIRKLLDERPAIKGISMPGMPTGSPGMSGPKTGPFVIYEITAGERRAFAVE